jgi:DNA polymerase-3 subunit gamma/tau
VTRFKLVPASVEDRSLTEAERTRGGAFAEKLSIRVLSRAWQMLSKGLAEVQSSEKAAQAAEMILVRLAFASDLPTPDEALRVIREQEGSGAASNSGPAAPASTGGAPAARFTVSDGGSRGSAALQRETAPAPAAPSSAPRLAAFEEIVALAGEKRDLQIKHALEHYVRPVTMQEGRLEITLTPDAPVGFANNLSAKLHEWTGKRWVVVLSSQQGTATVSEQRKASQDALEQDVQNDPLVQAVMKRFPGAKIVNVKRRGEPAASAEADVPDPDMPPDPPDDDDRFN